MLLSEVGARPPHYGIRGVGGPIYNATSAFAGSVHVGNAELAVPRPSRGTASPEGETRSVLRPPAPSRPFSACPTETRIHRPRSGASPWRADARAPRSPSCG